MTYEVTYDTEGYWLTERRGSFVSERRRIWHARMKGKEVVYIEPCGAIPDGTHITLSDVERLLNQSVIAPHERDEEYERLGIGFDPMGESESADEDRNVSILLRYEWE